MKTEKSDNRNQRNERCKVDNPVFIGKAAALFGIPTANFMKSLLKPRIKVGTEMVQKSQNSEQV